MMERPIGASSGDHVSRDQLGFPLIGTEDDIVPEELSEVFVRLLAGVVGNEAILDGLFPSRVQPEIQSA